MYIAGWKTVNDWMAMRARLHIGTDNSAWHEAAVAFFHERLSTRYLDPIACIQKYGTFRGEGFSISAIPNCYI
jgi:hypothetical protein